MTDTRKPVGNIPPFGLRLQEALKSRIEDAARSAGRSMNAEIADRLERSFDEWPRVQLEAHIRNRSRYLSDENRATCETEISKFANDIVFGMLPDQNMEIVYLEAALDRIVEGNAGAGKSEEELTANMTAFFESYKTLLPDDLVEEVGAMFQRKIVNINGRG